MKTIRQTRHCQQRHKPYLHRLQSISPRSQYTDNSFVMTTFTSAKDFAKWKIVTACKFDKVFMS